ncbi:ATP-binding protein [Aquihabitans sp. G128]|uniref:ATP-binding protein n=1 Tax=Aquihabitans sp. G128 TaxID=2849779 RepID=UPI001C2176C3|nr:ATP-binding protein [Aquihabitans sp. G128]QXC60108.1 ATP-binding protein [Aquihabitans sp. G128]
MEEPAADTVPSAETVELELPARPEVVSVARLVVGAVAAVEPLFDEERGADLRLAVSEACTNAIQAQLADHPGADPTAPIVLRCSVGDGRIRLAVQDHGGGFDPEGLQAHPEVTDPARLEHEGGLGIPLIRLLADELEFQPTPGGTTVVMTFGPRVAVDRSVV